MARKQPLFGIVTFNYDRLLEYAVQVALRGIGVTMSLQDIVSTLRIQHVYGDLAIEHPSDGLEFVAKEVTLDEVRRAAGSLRLITAPSPRADNGAIAAMRSMVEEAQRLVFLGFGFDQENLSLLGLDQQADRRRGRKVALATSIGMTGRESVEVSKLVQRAEIEFHSVDCLELLRAHQSPNWFLGRGNP